MKKIFIWGMCEMLIIFDVYKLLVYKNSVKLNKIFFSEVIFYFLKYGGFKVSKLKCFYIYC